MKKFQVGSTYSARSICNYDIVWSFEILRRTEKSVWVKVDGRKVRRAIEVCRDCESFYPFGKYSMAAVIMADREN